MEYWLDMKKPFAMIRQVAALPYRFESPGTPLVMLITSLDSHRWVIPKATLKTRLTPFRAAAREAYVEAGIFGVANPVPLGGYRYEKRRHDGSTRLACVTVFPLAFLVKSTEWPERQKRERKWFTLEEAADAVEELALKSMIATFELDTNHC